MMGVSYLKDHSDIRMSDSAGNLPDVSLDICLEGWSKAHDGKFNFQIAFDLE
jgi:hypothetical protein